MSTFRLAAIAYVPPPRFTGAEVFLENVRKFKPSTELFLYSDHDPYGVWPMANPEGLANIREHKWGVNNAVFIMGIRLAVRQGFTHIIYLEADCRVGCVGWDGVVFEEYFKQKFPPVAAGSLVTHSCVSGGGEFYDRFSDMIGRNRLDKNSYSIPIYGIPVPDSRRNEWPAMSETIIPPGYSKDPEIKRYKPAVYPNGALGVYDVAWMCELFHINQEGQFKEGHHLVEIVEDVAWDHSLGWRLYDRFGADVFTVTAHLNSVYSRYGDRLDTEAQRLQWLREGKYCCVHQIKSPISI